MNLLYLIKQLGSDFDLLTHSDEWLEEARKSVSSDLEKVAKELKAIIVAQRTKKLLQDKNMVAVQSLVRSDDGNVTDVLINLMTLPEALKLLANTDQDTLNDLFVQAQIEGWHKDGYDLEQSLDIVTKRKANET